MLKKSSMRAIARSVLAERGYETRPRSGQGLLPGSRLLAKKGAEEIEVAVKASIERSLSFTKQSTSRWRTASSVDLVLAVVPDKNDRTALEVLAFKRAPLVAQFDKAWNALMKAGRPLSFEIPVFIPLDEVSRKKVGHNVANLKKLADWSVSLSPKEVRERTSPPPEGSFIDRVKREFAERNGVDVSEVEVEFRIKS